MPKTKAGERITWKEFFKRWGRGIEAITPLQQVKGQIQSTWIIIIGITIGLIFCLLSIRNLWWLGIILFGALGNSLITLIGLTQKKRMLNQFNIQIKQAMEVQNVR